jgi:hypothetical protein
MWFEQRHRHLSESKRERGGQMTAIQPWLEDPNGCHPTLLGCWHSEIVENGSGFGPICSRRKINSIR